MSYEVIESERRRLMLSSVKRYKRPAAFLKYFMDFGQKTKKGGNDHGYEKVKMDLLGHFSDLGLRNVSMKMRHRVREFSVANSRFP